MEDNLKNLEKKLKGFIFSPCSIREVLNKKFPKNSFLVENLIPEKGITIISGQPGCGKSWVALHIIQCIASQKEVFGKFKTKRVKTLLVDGETGFNEVQRRLKLMKFRADRDIDISSEENVKLDKENDLSKIIDYIEMEKIGFVVLDPFISFHNRDENTANEMQKVMDAVKEITHTGATVLIIHHHRKNEDGSNPSQHIRGSSAIHGAIDSHIEVKGEDGELEVIQLSQHKARRGKAEKSFIVKMEDQNGMTFKFVDYVQKPLNTAQEAKDIILTILNPEVGKDLKFIHAEINKTIRIGESKVRVILKELTTLEKVKMTTLGHNTFLYFLSEKIKKPVV